MRNRINQLKYFRVTGYAVNQRGLTVGINYDVKATSDRNAISEASQLAAENGLTNIRVSYVREGGIFNADQRLAVDSSWMVSVARPWTRPWT